MHARPMRGRTVSVSYEEFIESVASQLRSYANEYPTDLILLVNHLKLIEMEILNSAEFKNQKK